MFQTKLAGHLLTLCLMILSSGCGTTEPIGVYCYEPEVIEKDRIVSVPSYLTTQIETISKPETADTLAIGAYLKQCMVRIDQANGQFSEIAGLKGNN